MVVTVYKLAHHGAQLLANKLITCLAHRPKAIFASSNPWRKVFLHPRCDVINRFINIVKTLCMPEVTDPNDPSYCSQHPERHLPIKDRVQMVGIYYQIQCNIIN